jgi:alditol oxidase
VTAVLRNWAGNVTFSPAAFHRPRSIDELSRIVAAARQVRVLGTGHSFSRVADTTGDLVTLADLPPRFDLDVAAGTVTVAAGTTYGQVAQQLQRAGLALPNLGSLPHICVAGACATGTHGSGDRNGVLATAVRGMELVTADGDLVTLDRDRTPEFDGCVVALGALGVVTALTLQVGPAFAVRQVVFDDLPFEPGLERFDQVMAAGYSVSLFTSWRRDRFELAWLKQLADDDPAPSAALLTDLGASPADGARHPIAGMPVEHATQQLGVPGPWNERLPHFRFEHLPSAGEELQTEYLLPREHAADALRALAGIRDRFGHLVLVGEVRTVAADPLWLSPSHGRDSVALHLTWVPDQPAVEAVLPLLEAALAPFDPRPHWGKVATVPAAEVRERYPRFADFRALAGRFDPGGRFRNAVLDDLLD